MCENQYYLCSLCKSVTLAAGVAKRVSLGSKEVEWDRFCWNQRPIFALLIFYQLWCLDQLYSGTGLETYCCFRAHLLLFRLLRLKLCLYRWERAFKQSHVWCNTQATLWNWRVAACEGAMEVSLHRLSNSTCDGDCASETGTLWSWWIKM